MVTFESPSIFRAFQLTLWQAGKEVKTYRIGIGRKEFPLPSGLRRSTQIVFNPDWVRARQLTGGGP